MFFKKKLFGKNIEPNCNYCIHLQEGDGNNFICKKLRHAKKSTKCRHFYYDPLKRVPTVLPKLPKYNPEDFSL